MIYYSPHRKAHRRWKGQTRLCRLTIAVQILLLLTVSLVVCGLLEMSDMGASLLSLSGQKAMDQAPLEVGEGQGQEGSTKYTYTYKTLPGYFMQDDPATDAAKFDFMSTNFGLIDRDYESDQSLPDGGRGSTQWQRFEHHISTLNRDAREDNDEDRRSAKRHGSNPPPQTRYVLFFLGRHGNGYHNIAERYYGNIAWDCHFSALYGDPDGIMTWSDAHLSKEGKRQAREVNTFWKNQTSQDAQKMSLPELYLVSPLDRTLETAEISFDGLGPNNGKLDAVVMEKVREGTGIHTCDRRSNVEYIRQKFPTYNVDLDPNLTETDEYWIGDRREPDDVLVKRLRGFFDDLMSNTALAGDKERISITSHSGAIGAMLKVLGHRKFSLTTGAVIPVFVKVQRKSSNDEKEDKTLGRRHGGGGEGANHEDPTLDLPDLGDAETDKSKWEPVPSCPADLDLATVGQKRWGMGLKEFLDGVEDGTLDPNAVPFEFTGRSKY
ncbi:putative phosphoglycerate mutase pmu1 [Cladophialophora chaetospira]|uniref:Phosphoglycerate mutase pmu1 n=1 Tax=Cladophialophora chaetospira TaxID=386627 RepID=A0AA39CCR3_9EURO|nr:putative phosphoglycerate mutase pmu1 [Cladophialophora chaetospira]